MTVYGTLGHEVGEVDRRPYWSIEALPHVMIRVKRIFPRIMPTHTAVAKVLDTPETSRDLEWLMDRFPLAMTGEVAELLARRASEHREREHAIDAILTGQRVEPLLGEPARTPRDYQLVAALMAKTARRMVIGDDVGLGKTFESALVLDAPDALPALVVCQPHLSKQWLRELFETWPWLRAHTVTSRTPYDPAKAKGSKGVQPDVLVVPYSKLAGWADTLAGQVKTVIFDEVQELRHGIDTAKGRAARRVADPAEYVLGLSATPVYNYGGEIHAIYSIISPDALGGHDEFLREWGGRMINNKSVVRDPAALGTYLRDSGLLLRRTREDVGREIPEPMRIRQDIDADPAAIDALGPDAEEMARLILDPSSDPKKRFHFAGKLDWKLRQATGVAKAPYVAAFTRMLLESERKVVMFGWHRAVYDIWLDQLAEFNPVLYTGSESPTQKHAAVQSFIHDEDTRVMVISLRSGAGLDGLQKVCSCAVFGELDWSPEVLTQGIGRLGRDGQAAAVAAYILVCPDGSDPVMDEVLGLKRQQAEGIRDPQAALFQATADTSEHVAKMARALLSRGRGATRSNAA